MNLGFNIFMLVCFFPILPIVYFILKNETKPKKNIIVGVTLPYEARINEEVFAALYIFKKQLNILAVILGILLIAPFFIKHSSVILTYYMIWLTIVIILPYIQYIKCHKKLKALKAEKGWYSPVAGKTFIDISVAVQPIKTIKAFWFIPPVIISLLPVIVSIYENKPDTITFVIIYAVNAAVVLLSCFFYRIILRQKSEIVDDNTNLNLSLTQIRRRNWGRFWLWLAWLTGLFSLFFWIFLFNVIGLLTTALTYTIAVLFIALKTEFSTRSAQQALTSESGKTFYADDDDYWINGIFYYNPNDVHLMVNNRVGFGTSINLAKTWGKVLIGFSALCIIAMPFVGIWTIAEEFTPIKIQVDNGSITGYHTNKSLEIKLADIQSVELIEALPSTYKVSGSGFKALLKGGFNVSSYGSCRLLLNPESSPFIVINANDSTYIFNAGDKEETLLVYSQIKK